MAGNLLDNDYTDKGYSAELQEIRDRLLLMAGRVEVIIGEAMTALIQRDYDRADATIASDHAINQDEMDLDALCLKLLACRQPMASDLRFVTLTLKMVTDLERIADLAVNICERARDLSRQPALGTFQTIPAMGRIVASMVKDAIDSFIAQDARLAQEVIDRDDELDEMYHAVFRHLLKLMTGDTSVVERGIHIQSVAKFLERMGDHATNLAEQVIFHVEGTDIRHTGKL